MRKSLLSLALLSVTITAQAQYRLNDLTFETYDAQSQAYVQTDSVHYHYSGIRGGYLANEQYYYVYDYSPISKSFNWSSGPHMSYSALMQCDSALLYQRQTSTSSVHTKNIQTFSNNMASTWNKYSIYSQNIPGKYNHRNSRSNHFTGGRLSAYTKEVPFFNSNDSFAHVYNAQNLLDSVITTYNHKSSNTLHSVVKYNYGQNNRLLSKEGYYTYSTTLSPSSKDTFLYTQGGLLDSVLRLNRDISTGNLDTSSWTVFSYNTNSQLTEQKHYLKDLFGNPGWQHIYTIKMSYNSSGQRTADTTYYDYAVHHLNTGLLKRALRTYGYDAYGIVNSYEVQYWDSTNKLWGGGADSLYGPAMRVNAMHTGKLSVGKTIAAGANEIQLYPIPAHNLITIKATMPDDKSFEVLVYDMQGAVIKRWQEQGVVNYTRTIPTDDIPAGTYILSLSGSDVHMTKRMVIVK